jgi:hypothetical protein
MIITTINTIKIVTFMAALHARKYVPDLQKKKEKLKFKFK